MRTPGAATARSVFNTVLGTALLAVQAVSGEWHWVPSGLAAALLGLPVAELANAWVLQPLAGLTSPRPPTPPSSPQPSPPSPGASSGAGE